MQELRGRPLVRKRLWGKSLSTPPVHNHTVTLARRVVVPQPSWLRRIETSPALDRSGGLMCVVKPDRRFGRFL